jgi:hypothetical protein
MWPGIEGGVIMTDPSPSPSPPSRTTQDSAAPRGAGSRLSAWRFPRLSVRPGACPSDPGTKQRRRLRAGRIHEQEPSHRPSCEVHGPCVRSAQQTIHIARVDAHHECRADDTAGHVPSNHEGDAAEHPALNEVMPGGQDPSNARREPFIVWHGYLLSPRPAVATRPRLTHPATVMKAYASSGRSQVNGLRGPGVRIVSYFTTVESGKNERHENQ